MAIHEFRLSEETQPSDASSWDTKAAAPATETKGDDKGIITLDYAAEWEQRAGESASV